MGEPAYVQHANVQPSMSTTQYEDTQNVQFDPIKSSLLFDGELLFNRYEITSQIGIGAFATVYKAFDIQSKKIVCIKKFVKFSSCRSLPQYNETNAMSDSDVFREAEIMSKLAHPNIPCFHGLLSDRDHFYLIMEYCEGKTLLEFINDAFDRVPPQIARNIFRQLISAISYLHEMGICHRDIKPENIIVDRLLNVKLIDFGLSAYIPEDGMFSDWCGSLYYISPEMMTEKAYNGQLADVWSLGVILFAMVHGCLPFQSTEEISKMMINYNYKINESYPIPYHCQDLLSKMLVSDPGKRIDVKGIKNHHWLKGQPFAKRNTDSTQFNTVFELPQFSSLPTKKNDNHINGGMKPTHAANFYDNLAPVKRQAISMTAKKTHRKKKITSLFIRPHMKRSLIEV
ncbi:Serine/threonine-protein kinase SRK2E [Tritrichomonas foetus]|uniref:Serine/threonine-protein kinase SRK2E n=1 Tax=Tritrichomonas foetus TaxID=1144522 RepID=A0A1J4J9W7_9EUKA|nr:Serine/threonine-protein kinase SRK2E [Tritrichomonas foetus]|eukprot:OHS95986.1 Serine/threonine-protein kinase SRK2E [Tritrichomonas foetus]